MFVNFNILNQLGSPAINSNTFANRPAAGQTGRLFVSTDTYEIYRDNGTTWDLIGGPGSSTITGTGTATQVAYFTSSQAIGSSANLFWDNTSGFLGVATATPSARIEAVKTDGVGIYANFTTNAGSGSSTTALWAKNVTNSSGFAAVIEENTPNTTAGQYPLLIKHSLSSGTAGVGMGTGIHWQLPDDAGTFKTTQLTIETINAAAATYATRYRFNVQNNGSSTPVAYINATGLGIFTATPGAALDIHSTGIMAQLNSTSATANSLLAFQRSGSGLWRIGDQYNSGNNFFELHNTVLTNNAIEIDAATNKSIFTALQTYTTGLARGNYFDYNLSVAAGGSFSSPNAITALGASLDLTLAGNATIPSGARSGLDAYNSISFTGTGTLTHNQGTQIRAYSNVTAGWAFAGSATGTITHLAGLRALFPDNSGSAVNVTNNYALLLNDQTANTGTVTYTNRWGVYQEGASDLNYMAANLLLGSTTNSGEKLQVTGNQILNGVLTLGTVAIPASGAARLFARNTDSNLYIQSGTGNTTYLLDSSQNSMYSVSPTAHNWLISNSVKMLLDSSGNLGLGVTPSAWRSADKVLQVNAAVLYNESNSNTWLGHNYYEDSGGNYRYIYSDFSSTIRQVNGQLIFYNSASGTAGNTFTFTERFRVTAAGNLCAGQVSGVARLNLTGVANEWVADLQANNTTGQGYGLVIRAGTNTSDYALYILNAGNSANLFAVRGDGGVGIGVAAPVYKLDVRGQGYFATTAGTNQITFGDTSNGTISAIQSNNNNLIFYNDGSNERGRFSSAGNFLIGTTTDNGNKLQVNGGTYIDSTLFVKTQSSGTSVTFRTTGGTNNPGIFISTTEATSKCLAIVSGSTGALDFGLGAGGGETFTLKGNGQARFVPLAANPAGAQAGDVYYNSTVNKLRLYDGTNWVDLN